MLYNELPTKISVISGHNNNNNSRELGLDTHVTTIIRSEP